MIYAISTTVLVLGVWFVFLFIKSEYRKFDERETIKENTIKERAKIKQSLDFLMETYEHNVYSNVKTNVDFCLKLILNKAPKEKLEGLKILNDMIYETSNRLKTNYMDVNYILAPMKNLRKKLFTEQMDFIKENIIDNEDLS